MTTDISKKRPTIAECESQTYEVVANAPGDAILTADPTWQIEEILVNGVRTKCWKHMPPYYRVWLLPLLKQWKDREMISTPAPLPAPEHAREHWTFGQVHAKAEIYAAFLRSLGVKTGTRVVISGINSAE